MIRDLHRRAAGKAEVDIKHRGGIEAMRQLLLAGEQRVEIELLGDNHTELAGPADLCRSGFVTAECPLCDVNVMCSPIGHLAA